MRSIIALGMGVVILAGVAASLSAQKAEKPDEGFVKLFAEEGAPKGWTVTTWDDVSKPGPKEAKWVVDKDGVLHGSEPRGTWLMSEKQYGDFVLDYEFKLGERGNSGLGIRVPAAGDPAFDGLEIQMADERYNEGRDGPDKLTGSIYKAIAPTKQVFKPTQWNHYVVTAKGPRITVVLNGETIQEINLDEHKAPIERHNGKPSPSLSERPRKGRIGFQELSRGGAHVMIRNVRIKEL